jgi:NAD-dependent deacetylase
MFESQLAILANRLRRARRVTVLTGAGVSAASGIPTFRGDGGLWQNFRVEELATREAFQSNPALVWEWYDWRRQKIAACDPNPAHHVLARWTNRFDGCTVITQNVDDLHLRAGTARLIRLHGSIWELACWSRCLATPWRDDRAPLPVLPATCPRCSGLARPAVVWFGESLSANDVDQARRACACDVFIAAGTSAIVYPAAGLLDEARSAGAFTAEINTETTAATSGVDVSLQGSAEVILPQLDELCFRPGGSEDPPLP